MRRCCTAGHKDGSVLLWLAEGTHGLQRLRCFAAAEAATPVRGLSLCAASALLLVAHATGAVTIWPFSGARAWAAAGQAGSHSHVLLKVGKTHPA